MDHLTAQCQRLWAASPGGPLPAAPAAPATPVRALVVALRSPADWAALAPLWRGVQTDFDWPEPAIAVNGTDAFELWFALAEGLPWAEAARLLHGLQRRYLGAVPAERVRCWPAPPSTRADAPNGPPTRSPICPPFAAAAERWAAFVAPDLPAVFGDDPALDVEPGADAQADLLARLQPVDPAALRRALAALPLQPEPVPPEPLSLEAVPPGPAEPAAPHLAAAPALGPYDDPRAFLRAVMNDPSIPLTLRIEAAKALCQALQQAA